MTGLPPKPGDILPPRPTRGGTSPRAASMRESPMSRERERDRDDWRRRSPDSRRFPSPRHDAWRRPGREDDRYQDQPLRVTRDRDEREGRRPRGGRDRGNVDTYVPDPRFTVARRRSPPASRHRLSRSPSRTRSPSSRRYHRSESSPDSRSPSPRGYSNRRRSSPGHPTSPHRPRNVSSRERRPRSDRSHSPQHKQEISASKRQEVKSSQLTSNDFLNKATGSQINKNVNLSVHEKVAPKLAAHPLPLGPKRPRTPTGPRARSPIHKTQDKIIETTVIRDIKGKDKEICRDGSDNKQQRERSRSPLRESRKPIGRSRSPSIPFSHSHSPSHSHSHSRHDTPLENAAHLKDASCKLHNIDDLIILPTLPRESKILEQQDIELKRIKEQRAKLDMEHISVTRAVRRAQHELDLALLELKYAEERRKAAEKAHERTVKGYLPPIA